MPLCFPAFSSAGSTEEGIMRATRLRTQLSLTMAAVAIAPLLFAGFLHAGRLGAEAEAVRLEHLEDRAVLTARLIESRIAALFLQVQGTAARLDARDPEGMRKELAQLAGTSPEYLWIGVADPEGRLLASTGGMPEDVDMSLRSWFRAGLQRPWVADFTDTQPLPPDLVDPPALVEMAAPVRSGEHLTGVVGAYIGRTWAETLLAASGKAGSAVLLDHRGRILLGPDIDRAVLEVSMHRRSAAVRSTAGGPEFLFASLGEPRTGARSGLADCHIRSGAAHPSTSERPDALPLAVDGLSSGLGDCRRDCRRPANNRSVHPACAVCKEPRRLSKRGSAA
jgi:hypothetical protein